MRNPVRTFVSMGYTLITGASKGIGADWAVRAAQAGQELSDYSLRRIGSELEGLVRQMLQAGEVSYNPEARVLNYSMGLPRSPETL
jgi:short-subunit dehydrogenase